MGIFNIGKIIYFTPIDNKKEINQKYQRHPETAKDVALHLQKGQEEEIGNLRSKKSKSKQNNIKIFENRH